MDQLTSDALAYFEAANVRHLLIRKMGRVPDVDDVMQTTFDKFIRAYRKHALAGPPLDRPKDYVRKIAINEIATWLRKKGSNRETQLPQDEIDRSEGPAQIAERTEAQSIIRAAVDSLPPKYRMVVQLHYMEDLSLAQIATIINRPLETIRTHAKRALVRLQRQPGVVSLCAS